MKLQVIKDYPYQKYRIVIQETEDLQYYWELYEEGKLIDNSVCPCSDITLTIENVENMAQGYEEFDQHFYCPIGIEEEFQYLIIK